MSFVKLVLISLARSVIVPLFLFGIYFGVEGIGWFAHRNTGCVIQEEYPEYLDCGTGLRLYRNNIRHVYFVGLETRGSAKIGVTMEDGSLVTVRAGSRNIDKTLDLLESP